MTTFDGEALEMGFQSIAVNGDTPGALNLVRGIRAASEENQVQVMPMSQLINKLNHFIHFQKAKFK